MMAYVANDRGAGLETCIPQNKRDGSIHQADSGDTTQQP